MAVPIPARRQHNPNRRVSMRRPDRDRLQHARPQKMDEQMKLMADVIDLAINKYLWDGRINTAGGYDDEFSCTAILAATIEANNRSKFPVNEKIVLSQCESAAREIMDFLQPMGVYPPSKTEFYTIPFGQKRQYARALWLTWAAMIAREEGETL